MQLENKATMHTNDGCSFDGSSCLGNLGCSKPAGGFDAYGDGFNANQGGIYAVEWNTDHISLWFFGRGSEPWDVLGDSPDPSQWGFPLTTFEGWNGCDIDSHFMDHQIVFDTTFCGKIIFYSQGGLPGDFIDVELQGIGLVVYLPRTVHVRPRG